MKTDSARWPKERLCVVAILFLAGVFVAMQALDYELGTLRRMGPGYFPLLLGILLSLLACIIALEPASPARAAVPGPGRRAVRPVLCILGGILMFALLIRNAGFIPAVLACVVAAGLAEPRNRLFEIVLLGLAVTVFASVVFIYGLGVPVRLVAL
ncbi:MAG: tripartite tricarboxylate transporter TctB family protein [Tropicimonas sp.]|uniref:tripartite tricarboxylate transporter TctB family protein n=1 Tax=Tropicimonas sp. TaxID=2067044 RepID=UPI003A8B6D2B